MNPKSKPDEHADLDRQPIQARDPEVAKNVTEKRWGGKRKHHYNPRIDAAIEEAYRQYREEGSRTALTELARRLGWPKWRVSRRGQELGLARTKELYWSAEEEALLAKVGHLSEQQIRKHLISAGYQRSEVAIRLKMKRLRIKQNLDGYSSRSLAVALGEDDHKIVKWIKLKMLHAEMRGQEREHDRYWITHEDVRRFVATYPGEIRLARVEKWWFLDLVSNGAISEKTAELTDLRAKVSALIAAAKVAEERRKLAEHTIAALERDLARRAEAARKVAIKDAEQKPRRIAIRTAFARVSDAIAQLQGRRVTREDSRHLQDLMARLEMALHLPAESPEPTNSVAAFFSAVQSL